MTKPRVFIVHEQYVRLPGGRLDRKLDLTAAESYGTLVRVFEGRDVPTDPDALVEIASEVLDDMTKDDYILPVGSPYLIGVVTAIATNITYGHLKMLVWDREGYKVFQAKIWDDEILEDEGA